MARYRTILAAVDQSPRAPAVVRAALELARCSVGTVHLFHAVAVPPEFPAAAANAPDPLPALLEARAKENLVKLAAADPRIEIVTPEVLHGQPWRAILATAARLEADLIVIGSHGFGGWDRLVGTTAAAVVNHADRCVLVVHERI